MFSPGNNLSNNKISQSEKRQQRSKMPWHCYQRDKWALYRLFNTNILLPIQTVL